MLINVNYLNNSRAPEYRWERNLIVAIIGSKNYLVKFIAFQTEEKLF